MRVLSLFDGMSCGQIALERAGISYTNYYASEIDKYCIKVTQANYPNTIQLGDVKDVRGGDLPSIDLMMGGSPCQGFSLAGKRLNFDDPRSVLFFEFVRLMEEVKPRYFLLENVRMKKESEDVITTYMGVEPVRIDSVLFSAQRRERLYWTNIPIKPIVPVDVMVSDIKQSDVGAKYNLSDIAKAKIERYSVGYQVCGKSPTLTTELAHSTGSHITPKLIKEIGENRRATPTECERLQTVPDGYTSCVSDTQRYRMLGNGWTVNVIAHILEGLKS